MTLLISALSGITAAAEWIGEATRYFALAAALFGGIATWADTHLPESKLLSASTKTAGKAALTLFVVVSLAACSQPYKAAWNTTYQVRQTGQLAEKVISLTATEKHKECLKKYGAKTVGYAECIKPYHEGLMYWRQIVRPTLNAALIATVTSIQLAEKNKDKKFDWMTALKPGACALIAMARQYEHMLKGKDKQILQYLELADTFVCKE